MGSPTLKEVREYFKNAETVITEFGAVVEMENVVFGHFTETFMLEKKGNTVWSPRGGYAEILTNKIEHNA